MSSKPTMATVLMSGGIDSTACAYHLRSRGLAVDGVFINYGQAAAEREAKAVTSIANHLGIVVRNVGIEGSQECGPGELLGRNAFMIFTALFFTRGRSGLLGLGLHAGTPYYDCSEEFIASIGRLVAEHTDGRVSVVTPFITWTKKDVYDYFVSTGLPTEATYSCEAGTEPTCGVCASCRDRRALGC
jgi:7-cyano-7-deazaguanine synthase